MMAECLFVGGAAALQSTTYAWFSIALVLECRLQDDLGAHRGERAGHLWIGLAFLASG
jgi:hypothetical protein